MFYNVFPNKSPGKESNKRVVAELPLEGNLYDKKQDQGPFIYKTRSPRT